MMQVINDCLVVDKQTMMTSSIIRAKTPTSIGPRQITSYFRSTVGKYRGEIHRGQHSTKLHELSHLSASVKTFKTSNYKSASKLSLLTTGRLHAFQMRNLEHGLMTWFWRKTGSRILSSKKIDKTVANLCHQELELEFSGSTG